MEHEKKTQNTEKTDRSRRNFLHLLCGGYLCFLAYQLAEAFVSDIAEVGWTGTMIVSLLGAVLFALVGCLLLVNMVRRVIAQAKTKDAEEENT